MSSVATTPLNCGKLIYRNLEFTNTNEVHFMPETTISTPLKIGLLTVVAAYFLFTLHALLTTSWVGEWESLPPTLRLVIYVEDIGATAGMIFRFIASLVAFAAVAVYFTKRSLGEHTTRRILMIVLFSEAIYWLGLLPSGLMPIIYFRARQPPLDALIALFSSDIPCLVESTAIPVALFMLVAKLRPRKSVREAIRWSLVSGTVYIFVFWLVNTGIWASAIMQKGFDYLTVYPENLAGFVLTVFGLLTLAGFAARFTKKYWGTESLRSLNLRVAGALITFLGLWFLWNYLTWVFLGRNELWSVWYAWFLGHNLDLWLLTIPLIGLPLMFSKKDDASGDSINL